MCTPNFGVIKYSYIQAIVLVIVDYLTKNPRAEFLLFRCDIFLFFKFCCLIDFLIPIVTWWVSNFSIKYLDLPVRFAAFAGLLTSLLSVAANSSWLKLIHTWCPVVFIYSILPCLENNFAFKPFLWKVFISTFYSFDNQKLRSAITSEQLASKCNRRKRWTYLTNDKDLLECNFTFLRFRSTFSFLCVKRNFAF